MDYNETIQYLFSKLPVYQNIGPGAYKPGLDTALRLDQAFGSPSRRLRCIHIAGTNGKGSTAHTLASVLQEAGYRTGLYTSPHIHDFRERIRVDGSKIDPEFVVDFVERYRRLPDSDLEPSFFELTTVMAFDYFAHSHVDVAVIETGLGGRLDSTNIINPLVSIITNISLDHTALLGNTHAQIAAEKAGIIKEDTPVVIGEADREDVAEVFRNTASLRHAPLLMARPVQAQATAEGFYYPDTRYGALMGELAGQCQPLNAATVLTALPVIAEKLPQGAERITAEAVRRGFARVTANTGLMGRWTQIACRPRTVIDTGHNIGGWEHITRQLAADPAPMLHLVMGFVADKDLDRILRLVAAVPRLDVWFAQPSAPRGLPARELARQAEAHGIHGTVCPDVNQAVARASALAADDDLLLIAGSNFLIADME